MRAHDAAPLTLWRQSGARQIIEREQPQSTTRTHRREARRQLNKSQLAMIAVKMLEPLKAEAKKRQVASLKQGGVSPVPTVPEERGESGEAVAQAAALVGLGTTSVYQARAVRDRARLEAAWTALTRGAP